MKNLLILTAMGIGDRYAMSAPTFWKTMNGFAKDGWSIWILNVGIRGGETRRVDYEDDVHILETTAPLQKMTRIRKIGFIFGIFQYAWIDRWHRRQAEALIREKGWSNADTVIYADDALGAKTGRKLSQKFGIKFVTRFYGIWNMYEKADTLKNRLRYYPRFGAYKVASDLLIMTNDGTRGDEMLRRVGNQAKNIRFWRNGVDIPDPTQPPANIPGLEDGDKVLITLSRLNPGKRVDRSIRALAEVRKTHPEAKLVVCGYGDEQRRLEQIAKEEGVRDATIFTGGLNHDQVFAYLKRGDIFLSFYEASNLGNPVFEAMRCGLPVIASDVGATNTVVIHEVTGLLLPQKGIEDEIPRAICRLLEDPELTRRLGEGALRFASEHFWTWDERVAAEIRAVNELLAKGE